MTFGYDADTVSFRGMSQSTFSDHASNLVNRLASFRQNEAAQTRRIGFVTHSLGGLIVAKALQFAYGHHESSLRQIERYTVGIIFLGAS